MENTARIKADELHALLTTMSPAEQQPVTTRTFIADIEQEIARQLEEPPARYPAATPAPAAIEIHSTLSKKLGHTVKISALTEPVVIRLEPRVRDLRYFAMMFVMLLALAAAFFLL